MPRRKTGWRLALSNVHQLSQSVDSLKRVELEVVHLVEPAAFEVLQRQAGASREGERVDRQLHVRVLFLSGVRLVVEDVDMAVWDLPEVDVAGDYVAFEVEVKRVLSVIGDVLTREKDGNFHGDRHGIIDQ